MGSIEGISQDLSDLDGRVIDVVEAIRRYHLFVELKEHCRRTWNREWWEIIVCDAIFHPKSRIHLFSVLQEFNDARTTSIHGLSLEGDVEKHLLTFLLNNNRSLGYTDKPKSVTDILTFALTCYISVKFEYSLYCVGGYPLSMVTEVSKNYHSNVNFFVMGTKSPMELMRQIIVDVEEGPGFQLTVVESARDTEYKADVSASHEYSSDSLVISSIAKATDEHFAMIKPSSDVPWAVKRHTLCWVGHKVLFEFVSQDSATGYTDLESIFDTFDLSCCCFALNVKKLVHSFGEICIPRIITTHPKYFNSVLQHHMWVQRSSSQDSSPDIAAYRRVARYIIDKGFILHYDEALYGDNILKMPVNDPLGLKYSFNGKYYVLSPRTM